MIGGGPGLLSARLLFGAAVLLSLTAERSGSLEQQFRWLVGEWMYEGMRAGGPAPRRERWTSVNPNRLAADDGWVAADVQPDQNVDVRIGAGGPVFYVLTTPGGLRRSYRLTRARPGEAVFEDPAGDFPQRIEYRLDGDVLTHTLSGLDGAGRIVRRMRRRAEAAR